jgi:putative PIN family toxin of toxin-antitoxin system
MRLVIDTDVVIAAMRNPTGASAAFLRLLIQAKESWLLSVGMAFEYEANCMLAEHRLAAHASERDVRNLLAVIFEVIVPVEVHYQWRPQLTDAGAEMVLEAAVNGRADAIVTFSSAHFGLAPGRFGIRLLEACEGGGGDRGMTTKVSTFSLRLPISLKAAVERMAASDGTSMNQFLVMAAAEKLASIQTAESYFAGFRGVGNREEALAFLSRSGGEASGGEDEVEDDDESQDR